MAKPKEKNLEKQFEKQMGCMTGFFQIFDRHQIISGRRSCSTKRLPHSKAVDDEDESEMSGSSTPAISREIMKLQGTDGEGNVKSPVQEVFPPKSPHRLSVFEFKEETRASRKFARETPRLSLDSRAIVDSKGSVHPREIRTNASIVTANRCDSPVAGSGEDSDDKQRRSPSVIARLMGLEQLPASNPEYEKAQLRRSASESRAVRDYRSADNAKSSQFLKQINQSHSEFVIQSLKSAAYVNQTECQFSVDFTRCGNATQPHSIRNTTGTVEQQKAVNRGLWKSQQHRKSHFNTADVFPEPKLTMSPYAADVEKKLKVRGIDEASANLETPKQILEAMQFKGLLHSKMAPEHRNFVYDRYLPIECSPTMTKPSGSHYRRTIGNDSPPPKSTVRRNLNNTLSSVSPRKDRTHIDSNVRTPARNRNSLTHNESSERRNSNSIVKTKPLSIESPRQRNESIDNRRTSPVQSPRMRSKTDQTVTNKSPRCKRSKAEDYQQEKINSVLTEDESSSISESTFSTSSHPDTERWKMEGCTEGKSLLERCDKLLQSIADMNATDLQPSPVSVLDSSTFYKEDYPPSPSPVLKRSIDFKDQSSDFEEEWGSSIFEPYESKLDDIQNEDPDFIYISQILRAFDYIPEDFDVFLILEKRHYFEGKYNCKASILHRRIIFDIVTEILERNKQLPPPWKTHSFSKPLLQKIWTEFQRIRHHIVADDVFEIICGVLEKDLAEDVFGGWDNCPMEMSEAVLDIERLIFKDLIGETIREVVVYAWRSPGVVAYRRKLVF